MPSFRKKFRNKLVTRKKKAAQQFRRGSKTFRHNKNLRQNISVKKLYTKGKNVGKQYRRVTRGFLGGISDEEKLQEMNAAIQKASELVAQHNKEALKAEAAAASATVNADAARQHNAAWKARVMATAASEDLVKLYEQYAAISPHSPGDWNGGARNAYKRL